MTVTDIGSSKIQFDLQVDPNKSSGDITGLFFNVAGGVTGVTEGMFSGADLATACVVPGGTLSCGSNDNNLNGVSGLPAGSFTVGLAFGTQGNNAITSTSVIFNYAASGRTFTESSFAPMAGRMKSIEGTGGSATLVDLVPPTVPDTETQTPEPSTLLMLGAGLGALALARVRAARRA
ncbi:MAG: PEP-CTERM sorting domain-containing protein [Bryobacterales bacterium]|nr:PEP-CTERM sorting domain-containing protein [Bryobacterales bacterium]